MTITEATGTLPTLPGRYYYDPAIHAAERAHIFGQGWLCVGYAAQSPDSGDYLTVELDGEGAIVVHGQDGVVRAFLNVCRHRGARLCAAEPCGQLTGAIRCKYHAWTYALDGRLIGVPNMPGEGLDREAHGLVPVALAEWDGLLYLNFAGGRRGRFPGADERGTARTLRRGRIVRALPAGRPAGGAQHQLRRARELEAGNREFPGVLPLRADAPGTLRSVARLPGRRGLPAGARHRLRRGSRGVSG